MSIQRKNQVLVIDQIDDELDFINKVLISAGYEVFTYPHINELCVFEEALAIIDQWQPTLLILDSAINTVDAQKLIQEIKSRYDSRHVPVLLLTEPESPVRYPMFIEWGADGFIPRPLNVMQLLSSIDNLMQINRCNVCLSSEQKKINKIDYLTSLPNRFAFQEILKLHCNAEAAIPSAGTEHSFRTFHLIIFDIDNFKRVNDALGHSVGDILIKYISHRIRGALNNYESIAHLGGGSFSLIMDVDEGEVMHIISTLNKVLASPFIVSGQEVLLTYSQGISHFPGDGEDWETLLKHAEIALYEAKNQGKATYRFFDPKMDRKLIRQFKLLADLRNAAARNEFQLLYQPQVAVPDGRIVGMEALIRWNHPELGVVSPMEFIPLAEDSEVISEIGNWVIETACCENRRWQEQEILQAVVAVNVSARQFKDGTILDSIKNALDKSGLEPGFLEIELTEGLLMEQPDVSAHVLNEIRSMGVTVAIDDFGTGYSSLSYLKHFPLDQIKIDRSFVQNITTESDDSAIVRSIIGMAAHLKREVIAEGVETEEQLDYLYRNHCYEYQGYLFSKPLPASHITPGFKTHYPCVAQLHYKVNGQQTVLLLNESEVRIQAVKHMFENTPFRLFCATNKTDGLSFLARESVNIIVCNQHFSGTNCIDFIHEVRELYPDILVIALADESTVASLLPSVNNGTISKLLVESSTNQELMKNIESSFHHIRLDRDSLALKQKINKAMC